MLTGFSVGGIRRTESIFMSIMNDGTRDRKSRLTTSYCEKYRASAIAAHIAASESRGRTASWPPLSGIPDRRPFRIPALWVTRSRGFVTLSSMLAHRRSCETDIGVGRIATQLRLMARESFRNKQRASLAIGIRAVFSCVAWPCDSACGHAYLHAVRHS